MILEESTLRRSKTRMDMKRETTTSTKVRPKTTMNKSINSRSIKSAPIIHRSKSQLVLTSKRKEKSNNSSRSIATPIIAANSV